MCERFSFSGMPAMYRLHVCADLSFDPSVILMEIGLLSGCTYVSRVHGRTKFLVAPASDMALFGYLYY